jgi:hypothetical protein
MKGLSAGPSNRVPRARAPTPAGLRSGGPDGLTADPPSGAPCRHPAVRVRRKVDSGYVGGERSTAGGQGARRSIATVPWRRVAERRDGPEAAYAWAAVASNGPVRTAGGRLRGPHHGRLRGGLVRTATTTAGRPRIETGPIGAQSPARGGTVTCCRTIKCRVLRDTSPVTSGSSESTEEETGRGQRAISSKGLSTTAAQCERLAGRRASEVHLHRSRPSRS